MKFPCKECIKKTNGGCCNVNPVMNYSEAAKVSYKYMELLQKKNISIEKNGGIYAFYIEGQNNVCPFLDFEKGCLIYEDRPTLCRDFGKTIGECPYKGQDHITEIKHLKPIPINECLNYVKKKYQLMPKNSCLKEMDMRKTIKMTQDKELWHLALIASQLFQLDDLFEKVEKYVFIQTADNRLRPARLTTYKTDNISLKVLVKIHNFIYRKVSVMDYDAAEYWSEKLNKIVSQIPKVNIIDNEEDQLLLFLALFISKFRNSFKRKKNQYKGIVNSDEEYALFDEIFKRLGIQDKGVLKWTDERVQKMSEEVDKVYKMLQNSK